MLLVYKEVVILSMFSVGDTIVHNRYGAGTIVGSKTITLYGKTNEYLCIELTADRGTLMVKEEDVDPEEVRMTLENLDIIREVLNSKPTQLSDQHRSRQPKLQAKLRSNDPRLIAQVLRDLSYRSETDGLTETDKRIRDKAHHKLMAELNLSPKVKVTSTQLNSMVSKAIEKHLAKVN